MDDLDEEDFLCMDGDGYSFPEHDYDEIDCRRCGAEAGTY